MFGASAHTSTGTLPFGLMILRGGTTAASTVHNLSCFTLRFAMMAVRFCFPLCISHARYVSLNIAEGWRQRFAETVTELPDHFPSGI
ncbi:hypothetical protein [Andreprevotia sp. IGB-42]|uniref:hypothetical protein n=1 Tax=Andreprevotia sp. IGB-42 TaxID=2497473 RepID=UPI001F20AF40|nr:hypothetical protein [Andreprevotia sp. IGB-42]